MIFLLLYVYNLEFYLSWVVYVCYKYIEICNLYLLLYFSVQFYVEVLCILPVLEAYTCDEIFSKGTVPRSYLIKTKQFPGKVYLRIFYFSSVDFQPQHSIFRKVVSTIYSFVTKFLKKFSISWVNCVKVGEILFTGKYSP